MAGKIEERIEKEKEIQRRCVEKKYRGSLEEIEESENWLRLALDLADEYPDVISGVNYHAGGTNFIAPVVIRCGHSWIEGKSTEVESMSDIVPVLREVRRADLLMDEPEDSAAFGRRIWKFKNEEGETRIAVGLYFDTSGDQQGGPGCRIEEREVTRTERVLVCPDDEELETM